MLAADKLQLQSQLKQQATALKEKEFNLHHSNLMTVGTQAAVLAGLDITMFIEFNPHMDEEWGPELQIVARIIKFFYYITIVAAFCANMLVVSHTTALSVLGAGLALRGPDGSMMTATDGLYEERQSVFMTFGIGLACTVGSVVLGVWLLLHWEAALFCMLITLYTGRKIWINYQRVQLRFDYDESETVDFSDIMDGPAFIRAMPSKLKFGTSKRFMSASEATKDNDKRNAMNGGSGHSGPRLGAPRRSTSAPVIDETSSAGSTGNGYHYYHQDDTEGQRLLDVELQDSATVTDASVKRRGSRSSPHKDYIRTI